MLIQVKYGALNIARECDGYTYSTDIEDLQIGDIVLVPPTPYKHGDQEATVVNLTSDYEGPVKPLVGLVRRKNGPKTEVVHLSNPYQEVINRIRKEGWNQRQDSTLDQLIDILPIVNAIGCRDAGDVIRRLIEHGEKNRSSAQKGAS